MDLPQNGQAERIRQILSTRGLTFYRASQLSTQMFGRSSPFYLPPNLYHRLAASAVAPGIYQLFALSRVTNYRLSEWLALFGIDLDVIPQLQALVETKRTVVLDSSVYDRDAWVAWFTDWPGLAPANVDPLVLFAGRTLALDEEYIAGWFSFFPATHLTPYSGIESVPPSCFVRLRRGRRTISKYWDFDPQKRIRYHTDAEYEEHFRTVFALSVQRRLRSHAPVLAQLSGGMDSSSIVCMADDILAQGSAETPRLDTLSYFNDSEPNWNERPYFMKVEERRGRPGCHIDIGTDEALGFESGFPPFSAIPGTPNNHLSEIKRQFAACLTSRGIRIVLSGIGGDEFTGGVPTPVPELMDSLAGLRFIELAKQLRSWALQKRQPWFHLLLEAARRFVPTAIVGVPKHLRPAPWISQRMVQRHRSASTGYPSRVRFWGPDPSFQENILTLESLRRQLACSVKCAVPPHERRFPFLDRDFLEFMFGVPRGQIVRPGQRRSLMRRALTAIVPAEILNRKRKAFVARSPLLQISADWVGLTERSSRMVSVSAEIIDADAFRQAIECVHRGQQIQMVALLRTLALESWMKGLRIPRQMGGEPSDHRARICDLPRAERNYLTRRPIELS